MTLCRPVCRRASLRAFSLASAPPVLRNTLSRSPAELSDSSGATPSATGDRLRSGAALLELHRDRLEASTGHVDALGLELGERRLDVVVVEAVAVGRLGDDGLALGVLGAQRDLDRLVPQLLV